MAPKSQPIIVIKKKGGHGGHHGGAWKVAYADFVTAMMSLFIVLWLMGSSEKVKKAVAGYFNDPKGTANFLGTTMSGNGVAVTTKVSDHMRAVKEKLEEEIDAKKELQKLAKQIEITLTPEGMRIELIEDKNGTFFEIGSAKLSASGQELLALLAAELKTLPNPLLIEGHTDATPYSPDKNYSNWELSADRANSARRLLQADGVRADQVTQVRGYADQFLRVKNNPTDPSNRRISILVKNDEESVPDFSAAKVVSGSTPLTQPHKEPVSAAPPSPATTPAAPAPAAPAPAPSTSSATTPAVKPTQPPKPSAATPLVTHPQSPKPGWLDKLKSLLPSSKK
jgi:chemotaxis protein MotB